MGEYYRLVSIICPMKVLPADTQLPAHHLAARVVGVVVSTEKPKSCPYSSQAEPVSSVATTFECCSTRPTYPL